eukprot:Sdes_comp19935_c0_seq1m12409
MEEFWNFQWKKFRIGSQKKKNKESVAQDLLFGNSEENFPVENIPRNSKAESKEMREEEDFMSVFQDASFSSTRPQETLGEKFQPSFFRDLNGLKVAIKFRLRIWGTKKNLLKSDNFSFITGSQQIISGLDICTKHILRTKSHLARPKGLFKISPKYAYSSTNFLPNIPAGSHLELAFVVFSVQDAEEISKILHLEMDENQPVLAGAYLQPQLGDFVCVKVNFSQLQPKKIIFSQKLFFLWEKFPTREEIFHSLTLLSKFHPFSSSSSLQDIFSHNSSFKAEFQVLVSFCMKHLHYYAQKLQFIFPDQSKSASFPACLVQLEIISVIPHRFLLSNQIFSPVHSLHPIFISEHCLKDPFVEVRTSKQLNLNCASHHSLVRILVYFFQTCSDSLTPFVKKTASNEFCFRIGQSRAVRQSLIQPFFSTFEFRSDANFRNSLQNFFLSFLDETLKNVLIGVEKIATCFLPLCHQNQGLQKNQLLSFFAQNFISQLSPDLKSATFSPPTLSSSSTFSPLLPAQIQLFGFSFKVINVESCSPSQNLLLPLQDSLSLALSYKTIGTELFKTH